MTKDMLVDVARLLRERAGLKAEPVGRIRLHRLMVEGASEAGLPVDSYAELVDARPEAFRNLLDRVTVQHSDFFRDPAQFAAVAEIAGNASNARKTVWSAGCGNGQEPYSLAMLLDEVGRADWPIVASDVSFHALARTESGWYSESEVRGLSPERRQRYLVAAAGGFEISPALRRRVHAEHHNLAKSDPAPVADCSFVFCRNVLMYFGQEETAACIARLAAVISPGGYLFLGHSDSPGPMSEWFLPVTVSGALLQQRLRPTPRRVAVSGATGDRQALNVTGLLAEGQTAAAGGDLRSAIRAFRQATYLDPDMAVAFFHLGVALELAGDAREARRAFAAAGLAFMRSEGEADVTTLEGYTGRDLARAIAIKLTSAPARAKA